VHVKRFRALAFNGVWKTGMASHWGLLSPARLALDSFRHLGSVQPPDFLMLFSKLTFDINCH
jgi:hypothetical protein